MGTNGRREDGHAGRRRIHTRLPTLATAMTPLFTWSTITSRKMVSGSKCAVDGGGKKERVCVCGSGVVAGDWFMDVTP